MDSSGKIDWYVYDGSAHTVTGSTLPLNTWVYVVGTADGTSSKLYVNGLLSAKHERRKHLHGVHLT